jgi:S1-C subfamily serine protease
MKRRVALAVGAAAVVAGCLALGPGAVRAFGASDENPKVEKRVVVHTGGGRLGVSIEDPAGEARGATVRSVDEGSAAEKAGLKSGDVIVRFDGEAVRSSAQLARLVAETPAGRSVPIEVTRGGATQKLTATLAEGGRGMRLFGGDGHPFNFALPDFEIEAPELPGAPPAPPHAPLPPRAPHAPKVWTWNGDDGFMFHGLTSGPRKLGIEYMEMGEQLAAYFKLSGKSGVLVTSVDADGPAAKAGIKAGDVVTKLGTDAIADSGDLREAVSKAEGGKEVSLTVLREGRPVELKLTPAKPEPLVRKREARGVSL